MLIILGMYMFNGNPSLRVALIASPSLLVLASLPFMVRGYSLTEREIRVKRLGWNSRLPLADLHAVEGNADALSGAIRPLLIRGWFSFSGYYWSRKLGLFHAFVTDPSRAVVLRFTRKTVVISPHDPQQFIVRARTYLNTAGFAA